MEEISLESALRLVDTGIAKAASIGSPSSIAVCDSSGHLKCMVRMDGAPPASAVLAMAKATSCAESGLSSSHLADPAADAHGAGRVLDHRFSILGGGLPIMSGDAAVGAVGVSGGTSHDVEAIAWTMASAAH